MRRRLIVTVAGALAVLPFVSGTSSGQNNAPFLGALNQDSRPKSIKPVPRAPDGTVNLGSVPGAKGHWIRTRRELVVDAKTANILPTDLKVEDIPFQPWAKALYTARWTAGFMLRWADGNELFE